jgi:hypothetical protein
MDECELSPAHRDHRRMRLTLVRLVSPKLYFVKMDITAAFDSIKQDKMLEVVSNFLDKVS